MFAPSVSRISAIILRLFLQRLTATAIASPIAVSRPASPITASSGMGLHGGTVVGQRCLQVGAVPNRTRPETVTLAPRDEAPATALTTLRRFTGRPFRRR